MNGYNYGAESVKYGVSFGTALAIAYTSTDRLVLAVVEKSLMFMEKAASASQSGRSFTGNARPNH